MNKMTFCCLLVAAGYSGGCDRRDCYLNGVECRESVEQSCTVISDSSGSNIVCADGTQVKIFNGKDGLDGKDGRDGKDGLNGKDGKDGRDGKDGLDGQSCTVSQIPEGAIITCGNHSVIVTNGEDGKNALLDVIVPCADGTNRRDDVMYKEIILRMSNGKMYAYFEIGNNRFLSELRPGSYQTTDGGACRFDIDSEGRYVMY